MEKRFWIKDLANIIISIPLRYNLEPKKLRAGKQILRNFNSTKVQFGDNLIREVTQKVVDFNSTKVQFGATCTRKDGGVYRIFQFH